MAESTTAIRRNSNDARIAEPKPNASDRILERRDTAVDYIGRGSDHSLDEAGCTVVDDEIIVIVTSDVACFLVSLACKPKFRNGFHHLRKRRTPYLSRYIPSPC